MSDIPTDTRDRVIRLEPQVVALHGKMNSVESKIDENFTKQGEAITQLDAKIDRILNRAQGALWIASALGLAGGYLAKFIPGLSGLLSSH